MKNAFFIPIIALMLVLCQACGDGASSSDEENTPDTEINDEMQSDADEEPVNCTDEWEKAEIIADPQKYYGFKVSTVKKNWKWDETGNTETIALMSHSYDRTKFIQIMDDGSIVLIGNLNGERCAECFNEFMHIYYPNGTLKIFGITGIDNSRVESVYQEYGSSEISILFGFSTISTEDASANNGTRYLLASINKETDFRYSAWHTDENYDMCGKLSSYKDGFFVTCQTSYLAEDGYNYEKTRIISGQNGKIYFKDSKENSGPVDSDVFKDQMIVSIINADLNSKNYLQKYSTGTLCLEEQVEEAWNSKPVQIENFKYTSKGFYGFLFIPGDEPDEPVDNDLGIDFFSGIASGIYVEDMEKGDFLISAGILSRVDNKGHRTFIRGYDQIFESDGTLYFATSATGDYDEDGTPTDEALAQEWETGYDNSFNVYITAIDKNLIPYVMKIDNGLPNTQVFQITGHDEYLYVAGTNSQYFDPEGTDRDIFLSRIKKDSIIKEENLVSEKSVRIQKFE